jgi:hypothetical protein
VGDRLRMQAVTHKKRAGASRAAETCCLAITTIQCDHAQLLD